MRLSRFTDYSLRVLIYLAQKEGELATIDEVACSFGISRNHLMKVVHCLAQVGVIKSYKGKSGGIEINGESPNWPLGDFIKVLEERETPFIECLSRESSCRIDGACGLKGILAKALNDFYHSLNNYSLADILEVKSSLKKLLLHEL